MASDDDLNIEITASGDDAEGAILDVISRFEKLRDSMAAAGAAGTQSTSAIAEGASEVSEAVEAAAGAQTAAAGQMVGALRSISAAQEQVVADLQGRFAQELSAHEALTNAEIALRMRWLENERQMGRMSLEDEQARLAELAEMTEANTAARIAAERTLQLVNAELVAQSIAEWRAEAEAGTLSAAEQIKALQSITAEAEYSLKVRSLASDEIARIEKANAVATAEAITASEREKRAAAAETAAEMKEAAYVAMDVGYGLSSVGIKGGKTLADLSYLARDFTAAGAGMVAQMAAIGIAVAAVTETIGFLGRGIKDAESEEVQMASIRVAVEAQGESWEAARASIEDYTGALQRNSIYSRGEALDAIDQLIARGLTYQQAEEAVTAAAELASAEHLKLADAVHLLTSAEGSRAAALERYDPALKALIERHASLHEIVLQVTQDFDGQMDAALDTTAGKSENLGHEMDELGKDFGQLVDGPLADFISDLDSVVRGIDSATGAVQRFLGAYETFEGRVNGVQQGFFQTLAYGVDPSLAASARAGRGGGGGFGDDAGDEMFERYSSASRHASPYDQPTGNQRGSGDDQAIRQRISMVAELYRTNRMTYDDALHQEDELKSKYALTTAQVNELTMAELRLQDERDAKARSATRAGESAERRADAAYRRRPVDEQLIGDGSGAGGKNADDIVSADKVLQANLKDLTASEASYRLAVDLATTSQQKATAEARLRAKEVGDAASAEALLTNMISAEKQERNDLSTQEAEATANATRLQEEHDRLAATLNRTGDRSGVLAARVSDLKKQYDDAHATATSLASSIDTLTTNIDANTDALAKYDKQSAVDEEFHKKQLLTYNEARAKAEESATEQRATYGRSLEAEEAYWNSRIAALDRGSSTYYADLAKFQDKLDELNDKIFDRDVTGSRKQSDALQSLADEEVTYDKSLAYQLAYYQKRYAAEIEADGQYSSEAESTMQKILSIELDEYKQRLDAQKQWVSQAQTAETSLLDDIITKHQSFHETLHEIFKEIGDDFIKMVERMIVEQPLLVSLEKTIAGLFGGATGGKGGLGGILGGGSPGGVGAGSGGVFGGGSSGAYGVRGSSLGAAGASQQIGKFDTSSYTSFWAGTSTATQISQQEAAAAASGAVGGSNLSASIGSLGSDPTSAQLDALGIPNAGGSDSGLGSGGVSISGPGGALGRVIGGAAIGATIGSLDGGNQTNASIGGALGGLAAVVTAANPIAGAALEIGGALLGSLFGSHANPGQNPDEFEGQTGYGQDIANLTGGTSGASGVAYYPSQTVEQFIAAENVPNNGLGQTNTLSNYNAGGGTSSGGIDAAEIWLAQNKNDTAQQLEQLGITPAQFQQFVAQIGESATGSGQFSAVPGDKNIGDVMVTGATTGGGTQTNYATLAADLNTIISASGNSTGVVPTFSVTRSYADPSIITGTTQTGTYLPTPTNLLGTPNAGATSTPTIDPQTGLPTGSTGVRGGGTLIPLQPPGGAAASVSVVINGNVVGPGGMDSIANEIAVALGRLQGGLVAGSNSGVTNANLLKFTGGA